jgi:translation initiation factor IF-3
LFYIENGYFYVGQPLRVAELIEQNRTAKAVPYTHKEVVTIAKFPEREREKDRVIMNERINFPKIRVVGEKGEQFGIISPMEALNIARSKGLDLIVITDKSDPPVCKIIDYGKYLYEKEKQKKEAKKKQKVMGSKELRIRPNISKHDLDVKIKQIIKFLEEKDKVKVLIQFVGRGRQYISLGDEIINTIIEAVKDLAIVEKDSYMSNNAITVNLMPVTKK